jgi:hypothetical protein
MRRGPIIVAPSILSTDFGRLLQGDQSLPAARLHPTGDLWFLHDAAA